MCLKLRMCLDERKNYEFIQVPGRRLCSGLRRCFLPDLLLLCISNDPAGKYDRDSKCNEYILPLDGIVI